MIIAKNTYQLRQVLSGQSKIGFVPTMGALHEGHLSLVQEALNMGCYTVTSIFVNPTQFNNSSDYEQYPETLDQDLKKLEETGCDVVFVPSVDEVYKGRKESAEYKHQFGYIETVLEGAFRPGHFEGVAQVVHILFELVRPDIAFFGEKDFQQLSIIRALVKKLKWPIEIVGKPTVREADGLALSSRNLRLTSVMRNEATVLYKALTMAKQSYGQRSNAQINRDVSQLVEASALELEYFEIIAPDSFKKVDNYQPGHSAQAVIAAYAGEVRLIDNLKLA